jgi:carboxypeptidase family protein
MRELLKALACVALIALPVTAQEATRGATIAGTVRDSAAQPIAGADIVMQPGSYRTRSDSVGNFMLTGLGGGAYTVAARKVGYAPDRWDVTLSKNGRLAIGFVLARRQLDTVVVTAKGDCPPYSLDGFECRRRAGGGLFLDYPDIDERRPSYTADLFRDIPGFRVELRRTRYGPMRVPAAANGYGCITSLVDGRPVTGARPIPTNPADLSAIEVYFKPDSVPLQYQRYTWPEGGDVVRSGRCSVVVYWTIWAPLTK